ncbi:hypothetical protein V8G54_017042 [Vigna mungo]|uniref:Uncharacterized protein n=1 Tax=Vigna mungo TaxID=3915 RepID=A0AAQ3RZX1_VIGMU
MSTIESPLRRAKTILLIRAVIRRQKPRQKGKTGFSQNILRNQITVVEIITRSIQQFLIFFNLVINLTLTQNGFGIHGTWPPSRDIQEPPFGIHQSLNHQAPILTQQRIINSEPSQPQNPETIGERTQAETHHNPLGTGAELEEVSQVVDDSLADGKEGAAGLQRRDTEASGYGGVG